jgi:hypothetical protein
MASRRPRDIGTAAESAVVRYVRTAGFPLAERRALRGALDAGDLTGTPGVCWSVKAGQMAKAASDGLVQLWVNELMGQVANAGADVGVLVVQRRGIGEANAGRWWGIMPPQHYLRLVLHGCQSCTERLGVWDLDGAGPIRQTLAQACSMLTYAGYGTPVSLLTEGISA